VDDKKITLMNWIVSARSPTNVISFPISRMPGEAVGDIVISVERAAAEAREAGIPFYERFFGLIVHGLVHILGYDHTKGASEARKMRYREKKLMEVVLGHPAYLALTDE
jgi:probable rRNA maturation factor